MKQKKKELLDSILETPEGIGKLMTVYCTPKRGSLHENNKAIEHLEELADKHTTKEKKQ